MRLMPVLPESIFDVCYLVFAVVSGIRLLRYANGRRDIRLFGWMALILGCGDAFHLVPRILNYWIDGDFTAALGIGKLVTSVTMTVFVFRKTAGRAPSLPCCGASSATSRSSSWA